MTKRFLARGRTKRRSILRWITWRDTHKMRRDRYVGADSRISSFCRATSFRDAGWYRIAIHGRENNWSYGSRMGVPGRRCGLTWNWINEGAKNGTRKLYSYIYIYIYLDWNSSRKKTFLIRHVIYIQIEKDRSFLFFLMKSSQLFTRK